MYLSSIYLFSNYLTRAWYIPSTVQATFYWALSRTTYAIKMRSQLDEGTIEKILQDIPLVTFLVTKQNKINKTKAHPHEFLLTAVHNSVFPDLLLTLLTISVLKSTLLESNC